MYWLLSSQFGIDLYKLGKGCINLPGYINNLIKFKNINSEQILFKPCLHDKNSEAGFIKNEYFWQDIFVSRLIYKKKPLRHLDIGSRIDGFVAQCAVFKKICVIDFRKLKSKIPGVRFINFDICKKIKSDNYILRNKWDSISCLHVIEHLGLGRYGDEIKQNCIEIAVSNMAFLLKKGGLLYLSCPIGIKRVEFDANRVLNSHELLFLCKNERLSCMGCFLISPLTGVQKIKVTKQNLSKINKKEYTLCLFVFKKD